MATSDDSLEILLNRATDPSQPQEDWERIAAFCNKINAELEGPVLSTRLIAHKIQSPQEKEALYALTTLEACVKECGRYFHQEIGKFRFLNELIKVVSPKYLGGRTPETVKKRCIEIVYSWHKGLAHEPKISEAYQMLKTQGIVRHDPTYMDKDFFPFPKPQTRKADFEDDEKAKTLETLLRSKNPEDLQAANRLIKNMVKEDVEKSEKRSRRINELEHVRNQVKLLTEMMNQFSAASSKEEREMMKELYDNLEKQRPSLFRLASDTDENDSAGINDILEANDSVTRVMTIYKQSVEGDQPVGDYSTSARDSSLLDLGLDGVGSRTAGAAGTNVSTSSALLESDFKSLGLGDVNDLGSIFSNAQGAQQQQMVPPTQMPMNQNPAMQTSPFGFGQQGMMGMPGPQPTGFPPGNPPMYSAISHNVPANGVPTPSPIALGGKESSAASLSMADLDILDKSLQDFNLSKNQFPAKAPTGKIPLNQMNKPKPSEPKQAAPLPSPALLGPSLFPPPASAAPDDALLISTATEASNGGEMGDFTPMVSAEPKPPELLPLTDVFVPLEKIQPAPGVSPVIAYEKAGVKVVVHFASERPRPDVVTMVVSSLSTCPTPVTGFSFQAAVPKSMKVKLQPPSASDFPAHNPILPPTAITQVMLVANPRKEKVRLKYKLSFTIDGKQVSDVGDIEGIPVQ